MDKMRFRLKSALAVAAIALAALSAQSPRAQQSASPAAAPAPATAGGSAASLPYEGEMLRLSEIMGALHFLRRLCSSNGASDWRDQMQALLEAEQPDPERRARMIDRFNHGYESYRSVYRECTPSARLVIQRYLDEGAKLASDVGQRYGKSVGQ